MIALRPPYGYAPQVRGFFNADFKTSAVVIIRPSQLGANDTDPTPFTEGSMPRRPYQPYIPQTIGEIVDHLGMMMLKSPSFKDDYFTEQNADTVFCSLNEGLKVVRKKLGEERYVALVSLSDRMRARFEADPEDKTDDGLAGRALIHEMEDILTKCKAANDQR